MSDTPPIRVIHKCSLELSPDHQKVMMPRHFDLVHCAMQHGRPTFWYVTEPDSDDYQQTFGIIGTGLPFPANWAHMGTCLDGNYVWHILMETEGKP